MAIRFMVALFFLVFGGTGVGLAQSPPPPPPSAPPPPVSPASTLPAPPACADSEYRALDFWVGEWEVFPNGAATAIATSSVEAMFGGCAIRETWKPFVGMGGGSLSHYDKERPYWRQAWVDCSGARIDFDGGPTEGRMVLTGHWANLSGKGRDGLLRMTFAKQPDGAVRQHGEQSIDYGLTWTTRFDFIYRLRKAEEN